MLRVELLRHAKSSWKEEGLADHDRPLAKRGKRAAVALARHIRKHDLQPQLVLCSTALRARETLERLQPALGDPTVRIEAALYGADDVALLNRLRAVPDGVASAMVVGHNPPVQGLALRLARPGPATEKLAAKYPTGALAVFDVDVEHWRDLAAGRGELVSFVRPKDLE